MQRNPCLCVPAFLFLAVTLPHAAVVDRVAVVIDKTVITESEVLEDLRLTDFINNHPLDLGAAARRAAAEHLVDQELIRRELENSGFGQASPGDADAPLRKFRQDRFQSLEEYRAALQKYGITEDQLRRRLLWQVTAIGFTEQRFRPFEIGSSSQSADRAVSDTASNTVDQRMDAWLKQARANSKITFKPEAFQ